MSDPPDHKHSLFVHRFAAVATTLLLIGCSGSADLAQHSPKLDEKIDSVEPPQPEPPQPEPPQLGPTETQLVDAGAESSIQATPTGETAGVEQPDPTTSIDRPIEQSELETNPNETSVSDVDSNPVPAETQPPSESSEDEQQVVEPAFRILLPTTSGPLVVDVEIRVGDRPLQVAFDDRIQAVIAEARGEDSDLTWTRLFEFVAADPQQFGRSSPVNSQQYKNVVRRYDKNRNKKPDQDEVARFLFRDAPYPGPFRLAGSDHFRDVNRSLSAVFAAIDENDNRLLEPKEIDRASVLLRQLDQNADQRIDFNEVVSFSADENPAWKKRRSSRWGQVATDLSGYIDWSMLSYALDEYDARGPFGQPQNVVAQLDQDDSGSIDRDEARELLSIDPDVRLRLRYPLVATGSAEVQITSVSEDLEPLVQLIDSTNSVRIVGSALSLTASVFDARTGRNQIPLEAFAMLDANDDGGLDEAEIPAAALREYSFEDLDENEDGKLTLREINEGMYPKSPIWNVQVRARGAESPDGVFAWLDTNHDQFLSTREVMAAKARLNAIASPEGNVKPTDIPDTYVVQFGRGEPNQDDQLFGRTSTQIDSDDVRPRWAQSMDTNRDGDISRQEFPGTASQFADLDLNNDGFINSDETSAQ